MISIQNVTKCFGTQKVLDGVSLEIPRGKITAIIGRSGEGKSVLLKHMIGLIKPDAGDVSVDGRNIGSMTDSDLLEHRKKFGMLFQDAALFDSLSVFENVAFPLVEHTKKSEAEISKRVTEVLSLVGLHDVEQKAPSELSGGMRKRVGLARAIALMPQIILYDEPTTGLDPIMTDSINQLISSTQKKLEDVTSVIISHDLEAAFRIADKVAMLHKGKILLEGNLEDFKKSKDPFVKQFLEGKATEKDL